MARRERDTDAGNAHHRHLRVPTSPDDAGSLDQTRHPHEFRIPPGAHFFFSQYVMHRSAEYWDHPNLFRPERFTGEAS
ncbi:MAG TPA: cytochrome P450 [Acidobacteriaceae bacterium]|nr:cytochrome P450 [Acidobacteriaceae bacterium]